MIAWWLALFVLQQPVPAASPRIQVGVAARPETVTVGEPFLLAVRVRAPKGAAITFPAGPDSLRSALEAVDPRTIRDTPDTGAVDRTALYRLVAWDTGGQGANLGELVVRVAGVAQRVPITGDRVYVRSVLPADTTRQVPKPARDIIPAGLAWWWWLVAAVVAAALVGLLVWWWRRRRRRRSAGPVDPFAEAEREFARIDALELLEAGERGRYVALNVEVVREYLAARLPDLRRSLTTTELLAAVSAEPVVPADRLAAALGEADLIKFARRPVTADRARELVRELRRVVEELERALTTPPAAQPERAA